MGEKFRHVVMMAAVVWGILPIWGLMASPLDIKGISLPCAFDIIFFNFFFQFNFIIYSDIPYLLSRTLICKKKIFKNMTYSNFVQYVPSDWESVLTE